MYLYFAKTGLKSILYLTLRRHKIQNVRTVYFLAKCVSKGRMATLELKPSRDLDERGGGEREDDTH